MECWICDEENPSGKSCGAVLWDAFAYQDHITSKHGKTDPLDDITKKHHIAANNKGRFWCGWCHKVKDFEVDGNEAQEKRFQHMEAHFLVDSYEDYEFVDNQIVGKTVLILSR